MTGYGTGRYGLGEYGEGEVVVPLPGSPFPDILGNWAGKKPDQTDENTPFIDLAIQLAWSTMLRLTAYMVVVEPITVRPACQHCAERTWYSSTAAFEAGLALPWNALSIRGWGSYATCGNGHREIPLARPVGRIVEVKVAGATLTPSAYRIDNGNKLTRIDGSAWPTQASPWSAPEDEFSITYFPGYRPDRLFVWATGQLAYEFYQAVIPEDMRDRDWRCRLPSGVTSVVRQGVSYDIENVPFSAGKTGIVEVDAVLARYNPNGLASRPSVLSADTLRRQPRLIGR